MRTRFAPSPTGPLHLGHAYAALIAAERAAPGKFFLRIEDLDQSRARPEWEAQIYEDLHWLGLNWPEPVLRQSDNRAAYDAALARLSEMGLLYACTCTRRDIAEAASAPQEGAPLGPDGIIYPETCRGRPAGPDDEGALRLDLSRIPDLALSFTETGPIYPGLHAPTLAELRRDVGDVVLRRRDGAPAYHLAVVVDDAAQDITEVTRGADLFEATQIHVLLQNILGLPVPRYHHHRLIRDESGKRLAKRDDARALSRYRTDGMTPAQIRQIVYASSSASQ